MRAPDPGRGCYPRDGDMTEIVAKCLGGVVGLFPGRPKRIPGDVHEVARSEPRALSVCRRPYVVFQLLGRES